MAARRRARARRAAPDDPARASGRRTPAHRGPRVIVLGIDTATPATAVALALPGAPILEERDDVEPGARPRHTERVLELAATLVGRPGSNGGRSSSSRWGSAPAPIPDCA